MNDTAVALTYGELLGTVAAEALHYGLTHNAAPIVNAADFPEPLRTTRATFVTLEEDAALRGCIGSVAARHALVEDVAANAYGAGFRDPRFPRLTEADFRRLSVGISILGPFETLACRSEDDLFAQARPGIDGFVLSAEGRRGLFLPQVWETLLTPRSFFDTLREKQAFREGTGPLNSTLRDSKCPLSPNEPWQAFFLLRVVLGSLRR